jgi:hypothetical protein
MSSTITGLPADLRLPRVATSGGRMRLYSQRDDDSDEHDNDDNAQCPSRAPYDRAAHERILRPNLGGHTNRRSTRFHTY